MKIRTILLSALCFALLGLSSCTKEGPVGPAGADGVDGIDGIDGVDANVVCLTCHNSTYRGDLAVQYQMTRHYNHTAVGYAGGRYDCARCHSHEGFVETVFTGMDTTAANIPIPTGIGCKTCHATHNTFDFENDGPDFALTTVDPIKLVIAPGETLDFGGTSNLCGTCHQPRRPAPIGDGNGNFNITSSHYGPHHAPNATVVYGIGGYEVAGSVAYPADGSSTHNSGSNCVSCHMGEFNNGTGGHTLVPTEASCTVCHSSGAPSMKSEIQGLIADLEALLMTEGVLDADAHVVTGEFPVDVAGAFFNWKLVKEDLSYGVHNPGYVRALLTNSIESIQ